MNTLLTKFIKDIKQRFLNLRTLEGAGIAAVGAGILGINFITAFLSPTITAGVGAALIGIGAVKFVTKVK